MAIVVSVDDVWLLPMLFETARRFHRAQPEGEVPLDDELLRVMPAQMEESGREIVTRVRMFELSSGTTIAWWSIESIAGMIMVWHPTTNITFIGPKSLTPSLLRWWMATPSLVMKMAQKKQTLIVVTILAALSNQTSDCGVSAFAIVLQFPTIYTKRKLIGIRATRIDTQRTIVRYRR